MELHGRVAVVTGGGSGIGAAMCRSLVDEGVRVVVADRDLPAAESVASGLADALAVRCDVSLAGEVDALRDAAVERFGAVHLVVNNAGVALAGAAWETSLEDWAWILGINVMGVVHGIRSFVPLLVDQGEGHVVNVASIAGLTSNPGLAAYNVSKHSVVTLSETLWRDLQVNGHAGVGVSVLCPGFVKTGLMRDPRTHSGATDVGKLMGDALVGGVDAGIDPGDVATAVIGAVRSSGFYVLTHPEVRPLVEQRCADILGERVPGPRASPS